MPVSLRSAVIPPLLRLALLGLASTGCSAGPGAGPDAASPLVGALVLDGGAPDLSPAPLLDVSPTSIVVRRHFGGVGESPLVFTFRSPVQLNGGGLPQSLTNGNTDRAIVQLELPEGGSTDEDASGSMGVADFSKPIFCQVGAANCANRGMDGYWKAEVVALDGTPREVQAAIAMDDPLSNNGNPYKNAIGVFLAIGAKVLVGEQVRLSFTGVASGRATTWTQRSFIAHLRYRSFALGGAGPWTVLDDNQVRAVDLKAGPARYVRAIMPLDTQVGVPFSVAVVVTDHYGNPSPYTGAIQLHLGVEATLTFNDEWRKELPGVVIAQPGPHKIVPDTGGTLREIYHYTNTWAGAPATQRLLGDTHSHSGDGGAQRKFIGTFVPGDHDALYSRSFDQLRHMQEVAGLDFGAVSEHAVRDDQYSQQLPPAVKNDVEFLPGGRCYGDGVGETVAGITGWWPRQQRIVQQYDAGAAGRFVAFPAFEWHASHTGANDKSLLHRVVMFRDFAADPNVGLPILAGDLNDVPPQCLLRFLDKAGFTPDQALVIPHMMTASDKNIDWDLTYSNSSVAPNSTVEQYHRVGEIFSARAIDQPLTPQAGRALMRVFEGDVNMPLMQQGKWTYRYGWKSDSAHIGVIGSSDNHTQFAGTNDDLDFINPNSPDRYTNNEPGAFAVVLASTRDRDGIWQGLRARRSYATSGVRVWMSYDIGGQPMGSQIALAGASATATVGLMAGMTIQKVELWSAKVGDTNGAWTLVKSDQPLAEVYSGQTVIPNPVAQGGGTQEHLYYVRAWLGTPGSQTDSDEAVWSSPIWIRWTR